MTIPLSELDHLPEPKDTEEEREEVQDFVEHIPTNEGDHLLVSTAATRFLVNRVFLSIYAKTDFDFAYSQKHNLVSPI